MMKFLVGSYTCEQCPMLRDGTVLRSSAVTIGTRALVVFSLLTWTVVNSECCRIEIVCHDLARGCSGDLHYDRPRNLPSNPPELLCICIVRVYTESYVDSQNSLFCLLTCNNDKSLYMPILWYVIISPNSI